MVALTITPANIQKDASNKHGQAIAGATITQGQPVYIDANRQAQLAANTSAAAAAAKGVAMNSVLSGQPLEYQMDGTVSYGTATEGIIYVIGAAGVVEPSADSTSNDYICVLGVGDSGGDIVMPSGGPVYGGQL